MLLKILNFVFAHLIGNLTENQKSELWQGLLMVLDHAVESGANGISKGAIESLKKQHPAKP